jgi:hypothetical protein
MHVLCTAIREVLALRVPRPLAEGARIACAAALTHNLRSLGYRQTSAVHPEQLIAPDRSTVDVNTLVSDAFASTDALDRLRHLLDASRDTAVAHAAP